MKKKVFRERYYEKPVIEEVTETKEVKEKPKKKKKSDK